MFHNNVYDVLQLYGKAIHIQHHFPLSFSLSFQQNFLFNYYYYKFCCNKFAA